MRNYLFSTVFDFTVWILIFLKCKDPQSTKDKIKIICYFSISHVFYTVEDEGD